IRTEGTARDALPEQREVDSASHPRERAGHLLAAAHLLTGPSRCIRGGAMKRAVLSRYNWAPLSTRAFIAARWLLTPYRRIASFLPERGTLLDLGCGDGLFAFAAL